MHNIDKTLSRLKYFGAPQAILQLAQGVPLNNELTYSCQTPLEFYILVRDYPGYMPFEKNLIPIWEYNGEAITAIVDGEKVFVIEYYYEDPAEEYKILGTSINSAIFRKLAWLVLEMECTQESWEKTALELEFPNYHKLYTELEKVFDYESVEEVVAWTEEYSKNYL